MLLIFLVEIPPQNITRIEWEFWLTISNIHVENNCWRKGEDWILSNYQTVGNIEGNYVFAIFFVKEYMRQESKNNVKVPYVFFRGGLRGKKCMHFCLNIDHVMYIVSIYRHVAFWNLLYSIWNVLILCIKSESWKCLWIVPICP